MNKCIFFCVSRKNTVEKDQLPTSKGAGQKILGGQISNTVNKKKIRFLG
jgi:hypothetical protein